MDLSYLEEIDVIVDVRVVGVVHAEGGVNVANVSVVIELLEELIGELSRAVEALPQVGTYAMKVNSDTSRTSRK